MTSGPPMTNRLAKKRLYQIVRLSRSCSFLHLSPNHTYSIMAELSPNELKAIRTCPLKKGLENFRVTFTSRYNSKNASNALDVKYAAPLIKLVLSQAEDADIWTAVLDLIARTRPIPQPTTPPQSHPSFTSSFQQTPWSFNTGSFADTSEHRNQVDDALKEELLPSLRIDIHDFVHAVFGLVPQLDELAEKVFDRCREGDAPLYTIGSGWAKWPRSANEELVLEWLQGLTNRFAVWTTERGERFAAGRQIYQGPGVYLDGSAVKRKMDVGITARHGQSKGHEDGVEEKSNTPISNCFPLTRSEVRPWVHSLWIHNALVAV